MNAFQQEMDGGKLSKLFRDDCALESNCGFKNNMTNVRCVQSIPSSSGDLMQYNPAKDQHIYTDGLEVRVRF